MDENIALDSEIAKVKKDINKLEVELRMIKDEREIERELALQARYIEKTKYLITLYKEKIRLFDLGKGRCTQTNH